MNRKQNILAIETTGPLASVALMDEEGNIQERSSKDKMSHLQHLVPMIGELLESCQLKIGDVTHIAASRGPGSFTGIRIGVATARALAQGLNLPTIGVPTLESFAYHQSEKVGLFCPILDARRDQVYGGVYDWEGEVLHCAVAEGAYGIEEFLEKIDDFDPNFQLPRRFFGDGISVYQNRIEQWYNSRPQVKASAKASVHFAEEENRFQKARSVAQLAARLLASGQTQSFEELHPVYLRKAEAERRLLERLEQGEQS